MRRYLMKAISKTEFLVEGSLNFDTVGDLLEEGKALFASSDTLIFNLGEVTNSNSAGLALLTGWMRFARQQKKSVTFTQLPPQILAIANVSGLEKILPIKR